MRDLEELGFNRVEVENDDGSKLLIFLREHDRRNHDSIKIHTGSETVSPRKYVIRHGVVHESALTLTKDEMLACLNELK